MRVTNTTSSLTYCIVAGSDEEVVRIRSAFDMVSPTVYLIDSFPSVKSFLEKANLLSRPDFIATDVRSLSELEDNELVQSALFLFKNGNPDIPVASNIIFDELHYPVDHIRLDNTLRKLERIKRLFGNENDRSTMTEPKRTSKTFLTKKGKEFILLTTDNIPAFYTDNKITFAYDSSGKKFMINLTLIELENSLDPNIFFRANRQFLINKNFISRVRQQDEGRFEIIIDCAEPITVQINQQKFSRFRQWIENA